jgi:peptidoglycan/LPS O-acetylase OafA/YrhL
MRSTQDTNLQAVRHENDRTRVTLLKGIAITAVVTIHILSSIPGYIYTTANAAQYIYLDQLLRFSVPLFIGLSGYALAKKYGTEIALVSFYKRRFSRLIPLYLLWSIGLWLLFRAIPVWNTADAYSPFWKVIILGRGDYHL